MTKLKKFISIFVLMLNDILAMFVSFLIAFFLRSALLLPVVPRFRTIKPLPFLTQFKHGFLMGIFVVLSVFLYEKLYVRKFSFWEEVRRLMRGTTISFILIMVLVFVSRAYMMVSRPVIVFTWLLSLMIFPLFRLAVKKIMMKLSIWKKKIFILGTNFTAVLVAQGVKENEGLGYEIAGFLTDDRERVGGRLSGIEIIGEISQVQSLAQAFEVRDVIIVLPEYSQERLMEIVESCENFAETIRIVPNIGSLFTIGVEIENFGDVLSLSVARNLIKPWNMILKNFFEYILAIILSVLLFPFFVLTALAIKADSPGPIIFVQERLGRKGKKFKFIKFRSMYLDADSKLGKFLEENREARKEWEDHQKIKGHDPRVTKVGKFIRKYSLDEIPQIINIFKGDISLVGPRPYLPREMDRIGKSHRIISRVKPGITGLWQVRGRNLLSFEERLILDEYYIRNWSLWLDIQILFQTFRALAKGAF